MSSIDFFSTFDESIVMVEDLCAQGFRVVAQPGLFDEPRAPVFDRVTDELVALLRLAPAFYLAGSFTRFPIPFMQLKDAPNAGKYAIDLLAQGPLMQGLVGRVNLVDGVRRLLPGYVSYQKLYRNPETGAWEKASAEVKAAHRQVVSVVKKRCRSHRLAGADVLIGPEALRLVENGEVEVKAHHVVRSRPG